MTTAQAPDAGLLGLDADAVKTYVPKALDGYVSIPVRTRQRWQRQSETLFHPVPNGVNDPLSVMLVLDAIMKLRPTDKIRTKFMVILLQAKSGHILWDTTVVGRILGELDEMAAEAFKEEDAPIVRKRDSLGNFWQVRLNATSYEWFTTLREAIGEAAEAFVKRELRGETPSRSGSAWGDVQRRPVAA